MKFSSFFNEFPELIGSEFRNITLPNNDTFKHIPPGNYAFLEMFCADISCDCRKVIINVISDNPFKIWTKLNYGWETEDYYKKWWGKQGGYRPMSGIDFDLPTNNPLEHEFFTLFQNVIQHDKNYANRIEAHYFMFKEKIRDKNKKMLSYENTVTKVTSKIGRNEPCPCNSGKKFKKCCLLSELI